MWAGSRGWVALVAAVLTVPALLAGCDEPVVALDDAGPTTCETPGAHTEAASGPDRKLLGQASPYPADGMLIARTEELVRSQRARRAAAWQVVARVLAPVSLTEPTSVDGSTVPRFRTWYDDQDVRRAFSRVYGGLDADSRAARARIPAGALDDALGWNVGAIDELAAWTPERWAAHVASLGDAEEIASVGGVVRIAASPDLVRHVIASYPEVLGCLADGAPPPFVAGPAETTQRLAREPLELSACTTRGVGPFFVAETGTLSAHLEGALAQGATTLAVREVVVDAPSIERCSTSGDAACTASGPGVFEVSVTSGPTGRGTGTSETGVLEVEYTAVASSPACLDGPFPLASASVAAEWRRVEIDRPLPVFDTSAERLTALLASDEATWGDGDAFAMPDPSAIYTQRLPRGEVFELAGLHIRTRELESWMNITLWFSPDPDSDFGADRPAEIEALGGPWGSYKMCVAVAFDEHDADATGGFSADAPELAAALAAVHEGVGGPSWCSNPYIDAAPGLVRTNCVGCHQHAMSGVRPGDVATDDMRFPDNGRLQMRNNFPADQFWGLDGGDDLAAELANVIDYWNAAP